MSEIIIRLAQLSDVPLILEIYNDVIIHTTAVYSYQPHTLAMRQRWFEERQASGYPVFVADINGAIAGFSSYGAFRIWPAYKYTIESSVHVHPEHRGKGIAKKLVLSLIEEAKQKDYHAMIAGIDAGNEISIHLHQQLGFVEVAHFKQVGYKFNRWLDLKFFELLLDTPTHPDEE